VRRLATIVCVVAAAGGLLIASGATGDDGGPYELRAIFDNGGFLVPGEEVRIAGAKVGEIVEVDVAREDEIVSLEDGGTAIPGKAVVVMRIDNPAFQDFREDASCIITPQSLLGERFVECRHTQPRSAAGEPPPALEQIPEGQPGEGQYLLPLENNGKVVDLDLVQNINRRPFAERFRLILNDLGAGFAARGEELAEIIERSNPALRETNEVLAILAQQNRALAELAEDSDQVLAPLARERDRIVGFIRNANEANQAAAERSADIEAGLARFPATLRELRLTMAQLQAFADQATPVVSDLGAAAPDLVRASEALGPFSDAGTEALLTLGDAADAAGPKIAAADPVILDLRTLARATKPAAASLAELLASLRETDGFERIMDLVFNTANGLNGFDSLGHYLRALLQVTNCVDYVIAPTTGCSANWVEAAPLDPDDKLAQSGERERGAAGVLGPAPGGSPGFQIPLPAEPTTPEVPAPEVVPEPPTPPAEEPPTTPDVAPDEGGTDQGSPPDQPQALRKRIKAARALLDFLMGDGA
jgi:phospholipid/cholesterol/gamma-HCH transport system substrate-binding protein